MVSRVEFFSFFIDLVKPVHYGKRNCIKTHEISDIVVYCLHDRYAVKGECILISTFLFPSF